MSNLLVVGGYGVVGGVVARALAGWFPGRVLVAGRDGERAAAFARSVPGVTAGITLDVSRPEELRSRLADVALVVMCVERGNHEVAAACLVRGVHVVDVSASATVLTEIEGLAPVADRAGAAAVLSVGLAPGLTNLLARSVVDRLPTASAVDISIGIGLGERHGPDSLRWVLRNLAVTGGPHRPRARPVVVDLDDLGRRRVHPFAFSDQHTLRRTLGVPVTTRVAFGSRPVTSAVFGLRTAGLLPVLRAPAAVRALHVLTRLQAGSDRFAVRVEAVDDDGARAWATATGAEQARATGRVAAHVARSVLDSPPTGVLHVDELPGRRELLDRLAEEVTVRTGTSAPWAGRGGPARREAGEPPV